MSDPILTYLFGHYNLLQVLASANMRRHTSRAIAIWRQLRIHIVVTFSCTCLDQRWPRRPFLQLPPSGSDSKTLRTGLKLSIRVTWPSHRRRCVLIIVTTSMSSYIQGATQKFQYVSNCLLVAPSVWKISHVMLC